jgi:hypothetical protein
LKILKIYYIIYIYIYKVNNEGSKAMSNLNLNELAALNLIFEFVPVKDLIVSAMNNFAEQEDTHSQDNADLCYKAVATFLK